MLFKKIRKMIAGIPGARKFYQSLKRFLLQALKPLLDVMLKLSGVTYNRWDVISNKNCGFMDEPDFKKGFEAALKQEFHANFGCWVVHINQWAAHHAKQLDGDFVECGVHRARLAMSNVVYLDFKSLKDRKYYLFDTFCGLDPAFSTPEELRLYHNSYQEEDNHRFVVESFKDFPNVVVVKGAVPMSLRQVSIEKVAYLSIDMNCVRPEIEALEFFWPRIVQGGVIILDDYAQRGHENQKRAIDQFACSSGARVLSLPTGQGMLLKV